LKKNDEIGIPTAIKEVVSTLAGLRVSTPDTIQDLLHTNFMRLVRDDASVQRNVQID
jgi:hypothetical protein